MTALPMPLRKFTPEEYLLIERGAETRSEYLDGDIYAMAGATVSHIIINDNLARLFGTQLQDTPCLGLSRDMKVPAVLGRLYAYPDYLIVCGERSFRDDQADVLINPSVIFEILSPSTERYDRVTKFDLYKQIDALREYVLIEQDAVRVEHFVRRPDGAWNQTVLVGFEASLTLESAPATVPLFDIYNRINFPSTFPAE